MSIYKIVKSIHEIKVPFPLSLRLLRVTITGCSFETVQKELRSERKEYWLLVKVYLIENYFKLQT